MWAARTYELGLYGIAASRWLRDLLARALRPARRLVPARRGPRRLPPAAGRAAARHGHLLRARATPRGAPFRSARSRSRSSSGAGRTRASCSSARTSELELPFRLRAARGGRARRRSPGAYSEATVGPLPLAHQLLADPAGDAGLRAPVRGPGRRQHRGRARPRTAASSWPSRTRSRSPTRSSACSTTATCGSSRSAAGIAQVRGRIVGRGGAAGGGGTARGAAGARAQSRRSLRRRSG